jgi:GFO/IDH/MocA oxidoreductase family protein
MGNIPAYVILGRGRWAGRLRPIISGVGRAVRSIEETRQRSSETNAAYVSRLAEAIKASAGQIAWLCVPPGHHVSLMIQAAIEAGVHVIVEKPWYGSEDESMSLEKLARRRGRVIAVHFEYCMLEEVEKWRKEFNPGDGLQFGGRFFLSRSDHIGIPPLDNLGCHLLAIREYAIPSSEVREISCGYELPDERRVWIARRKQQLASIDLLNHSQPIIQRFMEKVEAELGDAAFMFDLNFAFRVENAVRDPRRQSSK